MKIDCGFCGRRLPVSAQWRWYHWGERRGEWFRICSNARECDEAATARKALNRMEALL